MEFMSCGFGFKVFSGLRFPQSPAQAHSLVLLKVGMASLGFLNLSLHARPSAMLALESAALACSAHDKIRNLSGTVIVMCFAMLRCAIRNSKFKRAPDCQIASPTLRRPFCSHVLLRPRVAIYCQTHERCHKIPPTKLNNPLEARNPDAA